jgi:hypothetical protein
MLPASSLLFLQYIVSNENILLLTQFPSKANSTSTYGYFFKGKVVTPLSQLTATPPFPTPHILAQFAIKAYTN